MKDEIGRVCSTYGEKRQFGRKAIRKETTRKT
jgi:hypothetical protein